MQVPLHQPGGGYFQALRTLVTFAGPGILVSASYIDPGNLESDLQAGSKYGRSLLWALLLASVRACVCVCVGGCCHVCCELWPQPAVGAAV